jgi:hypothetical protein
MYNFVYKWALLKSELMEEIVFVLCYSNGFYKPHNPPQHCYQQGIDKT